MHYYCAYMHTVEWDNLRYVLLVSRTGSISEAARILRVNRTTVLRRIRGYEEKLKTKLFERGSTGYVLSPGAVKMLQAAEQMEEIMLDLERAIIGQETGLEGDLRVTTTDSLVDSMLGPHLASFSQRHPNIKLELIVTNHHLSLTRRDADVSIRPTNRPPKHLFGQQIGSFPFGIFATKSYMNKVQNVGIKEHDWLGLDETLIHSPAGAWQQKYLNGVTFKFLADSFLALRTVAEYGLGLAFMPIAVAEKSSKLIRVELDIPMAKVSLWILTHNDLWNVARVRAFIQHITTEMAD